jgi:Na+/H+ antiporter NhaD/arsenite permease-like protein
MLHDPLPFTLVWGIPFVGLLLSLAFFPAIAPRFWHHRYGVVLTGWMISFLVAQALLHHYIPFMALITVLFTIGGGIHITVRGKASPLMNAGMLGVGALLANFIGTMGASMLLIRPVIALNRYRQKISHVIIFFIFLVSNIGGILTPL